MHGRCMGTNRDGTSCSGQARPGRSMCAWHDPQLATERAAWRQKGGKSRSNQARARKQLPTNTMTMQEIQGLLGVAFKGVLAGKLAPNVGNATANIARALVSVREASEFEARLTALEAAAERGGETA